MAHKVDSWDMAWGPNIHEYLRDTVHDHHAHICPYQSFLRVVFWFVTQNYSSPHLIYAVLRQTLYTELWFRIIYGSKKEFHFSLSHPAQNTPG